MKIAIIKTGGKQYKVKEGQVVKIEKLELEGGTVANFDTLLVADEAGENVEIGAPSLGERVSGEIIKTEKQDKVLVVKYKNKTRYKRTIGHRQQMTSVRIDKIS